MKFDLGPLLRFACERALFPTLWFLPWRRHNAEFAAIWKLTLAPKPIPWSGADIGAQVELTGRFRHQSARTSFKQIEG